MHSYVFTFRSFRLVFLLALIASVTSVLSPTPQALAAQDYLVYLPIVRHTSTDGTQPPPPDGSPEQQALERLNYYRSLAGSPLLQLHSTLVSSSQNHANYYLLNYTDLSAWAYGYHGEVVGKPGYTGRTSGDRAAVAGYPWQAGWEIMAFYNNPIRTVDAWAATVFHRIGILEPYMQYMGYGSGNRGFENVDVVDFGRGPSDPSDQSHIVVFPGVGQSNVPLYGKKETPSPLPPGASEWYGYPITVQPATYLGVLMVTWAELRDGSGKAVAIHPNPSDCGTTCYALIPLNPLQKAMTYTVHMVGTVDDTPFDKTWTFTTTN